MRHLYDVIIIGGGPGGYTAALYAARAGLDTLVLEKLSAGGQMALTTQIDNYPGFEAGIDGFTLGEKMQQGAERFGAKTEIVEVDGVHLQGPVKTVHTNEGIFEAKTVILAMGAHPRKLGIPNEARLVGHGLHYCAACDGMFYKDKRIAVICNDKKYEHEVKYLADLATEVLYFPAYNDSEIELPNVKISKDVPIALIGDSFVEGITLRSGKTESVDGVFCLRNAIAPSKLMPQLEIENGHILVDRAQQTNVAGCFAAGDCTGRPYQYTKAVGEGNVAAHSCIQYLSKSEK